MALSQQEFAVILDAEQRINLANRLAAQLSGLIQDVKQHSDPANEFNNLQTFQNILNIYLDDYLAFKAQLISAVNNLP